jgi:hypothetical protein
MRNRKALKILNKISDSINNENVNDFLWLTESSTEIAAIFGRESDQYKIAQNFIPVNIIVANFDLRVNSNVKKYQKFITSCNSLANKGMTKPKEESKWEKRIWAINLLVVGASITMIEQNWKLITQWLLQLISK